MSLTGVYDFFEKAGRFQIRHRAVVLTAAAAVSVFGLSGLSRFKAEDGQDSWFSDAEQIRINQDHFEEIFGNDDSVMVLVQAPDVFAPDVLDAIDRLGRRLEAEVPFADSVTSLTHLSVAKGTEDGFEIVDPFEDGIPDDPAELAEKKRFIMSRDSLVNNLVSDDATETWVILSLLPFGDDEYADMYKVGNAAIPIVESDEFKGGPYTMKATGMSYTETEENAAVAHETSVRVVSGFAVMVLCLIFFTRSLRGVTVPLIATLFGIGSTLGFTGRLGISADSSLITLPILLGMALSVGYSIHYINSFKLYFRRTGRRYDSVITAVRETGWPILFTVITTVGSMISFMAVGIGPLKWLGGICAATVFAVYLYVIVLIPIFMSFGKDKNPVRDGAADGAIRPRADGQPAGFGTRGGAAETASADAAGTRGGDTAAAGTGFAADTGVADGTVTASASAAAAIAEAAAERPDGATKADAALEKFGAKVLARRRAVVIAGAAISAAAVLGMFRMTVNMDYCEMMGRKIPYVARLLDILNAKLGSQYSYNVMIEFDGEDAFKEPENMAAVDELMAELGALSQTKISAGKPRVTSVTDVVKEMYRAFNGDDPAFYAIPDDRAVLTELLFLYEISGGSDLSSWLGDDYAATFVHAELKGYDANGIVGDISAAKSAARRLFPGAKVSIVGQVVNYAEMNRKLVTGELKSFAGSFVIIAVLLIIAFSSVRLGLIAMIPNLAPVAVVGGLMGYAGFSLDMLTMTIMPMILGIAVDDTIHFVNHVKYSFERNGSYARSILITFREIGKTMATTTVILCAMFLMYTFSPMNMLFRVGLLAIIGLGSALVADYTLTPALIFITRPFGKGDSD